MKHWPTLALLIAGVAAAHAADPHELWAQAVRAKGGSRLQQVRSLAVYMKPAQVNLAGPPTTWLCVFPDRYFEFEGHAGSLGRRAVVVNEAADRVAADVMGVPRATRRLARREHDRLALNQIVFLLDSAWQHPLPIDAQRRVLTVEAGGLTFRIWLNKSSLPERVLATDHEYDYHLDRYREFQGVSLPTRVTSVMGMQERVWDVDYEVNSRFNPKFFERMPDLTDGPEPWRKP